MGIEPTRQPWEGRRLPLHHTRAPQGAFGSARCRPRPTTSPLHNWVRGGASFRAKRPDVTWIYSFPAWTFGPTAIVLACALAAAGLYLTLHFNRTTSEIAHNDVAGAIVATAGTIVAVMLSFMVVVVWQEFDASASNVQREASAVADLYHVAVDMPQPVRGELQASLDSYVEVVVKDEWPRMRYGGDSSEARLAAYGVGHELASFAPASQRQTTLQQQALGLYQTFIDARRQRLGDNAQGIPPVLWGTMLFSVCVLIYLTYSFRITRIATHYIMTIGVTAIIMSILVLTAELDYPFRGDIAIQPTAFTGIASEIHSSILPPVERY